MAESRNDDVYLVILFLEAEIFHFYCSVCCQSHSSVQLSYPHNIIVSIPKLYSYLCLHSPALFSWATHKPISVPTTLHSYLCLQSLYQLYSSEPHTNHVSPHNTALIPLPSKPSSVQLSHTHILSVPTLHSYLCLQSPALFSWATHKPISVPTTLHSYLCLQSPALLSWVTHKPMSVPALHS